MAEAPTLQSGMVESTPQNTSELAAYLIAQTDRLNSTLEGLSIPNRTGMPYGMEFVQHLGGAVQSLRNAQEQLTRYSPVLHSQGVANTPSSEKNPSSHLFNSELDASIAEKDAAIKPKETKSPEKIMPLTGSLGTLTSQKKDVLKSSSTVKKQSGSSKPPTSARPSQPLDRKIVPNRQIAPRFREKTLDDEIAIAERLVTTFKRNPFRTGPRYVRLLNGHPYGGANIKPEYRQIIENKWAELDSVERRVLVMTFAIGVSALQIGNILGKNPVKVQQIISHLFSESRTYDPDQEYTEMPEEQTARLSDTPVIDVRWKSINKGDDKFSNLNGATRITRLIFGSSEIEVRSDKSRPMYLFEKCGVLACFGLSNAEIAAAIHIESAHAKSNKRPFFKKIQGSIKNPVLNIATSDYFSIVSKNERLVLSSTQRQVAELVASGKEIPEIADAFEGVTASDVTDCLSKIFQRNGLKSRDQLTLAVLLSQDF